MGPCAHRTDARSPVAYSSSPNGNLWRITSGVLKGTYLSTQLECPYHGNSHTGCGWPVGQVAPTNQVPPVALPTRTSKESYDKPKKAWVLEALDLQGIKEWPKPEQKQVRELLFKWGHLFACSDLDLGKTALIKHKMEVTDWTPFKECYQCIPPHMYDNVRTHIQEMLDIGAIQKSHSP